MPDKHKEETARELLDRQFRELQEFEEDNPTDVALWPNPLREYAKELKKKNLKKQKALRKLFPKKPYSAKRLCQNTTLKWFSNLVDPP